MAAELTSTKLNAESHLLLVSAGELSGLRPVEMLMKPQGPIAPQTTP